MGVDGQAHHPKWSENPGQCYQVNGYFEFFNLFFFLIILFIFSYTRSSLLHGPFSSCSKQGPVDTDVPVK